jgi:hypothetical protein
MRARGMSLVEVLISATILFVGLAVLSDGYRASLAAGQKAATTAELLTPLPVIVGVIKQDLFRRLSDRVEGSGRVLGVQYKFVATSIRFAPPPAGYDFRSDSNRSFSPRYRLYSVDLMIVRGTADRRLVYRELVWQPELE